MVNFINNAETQRIANVVTRHFSNMSWTVSQTNRSDERVIQVSKKDISFFIRCIDTSVAKSIGVLALIDRLEKFTQAYRSRTGEAIVYVVAQLPGGLDGNTLPDKEIALFTEHDLSILMDIESLQYDSLPSLNKRNIIILRGCGPLCIAFANQAISVGNLDLAQKWLELNLNGVRRVIESRHKLIELLIRRKNFEEAKSTARAGLAISAYNLALLKQLHALEHQSGNVAVLDDLATSIATASIHRPSLDSILSKQQYKGGANSINIEINAKKRQNFLRRIFIRA